MQYNNNNCNNNQSQDVDLQEFQIIKWQQTTDNKQECQQCHKNREKQKSHWDVFNFKDHRTLSSL